MTTIEFVRLVEELRTNQKQFFKTRDKNVLMECKRIEKLVDSAIEQMKNGTQSNLF